MLQIIVIFIAILCFSSAFNVTESGGKVEVETPLMYVALSHQGSKVSLVH